MTTNFDVKKYGKLLAEAVPQSIENIDDLLHAERIVDRLLSKGENLSPEEEKLLILVSDLIEAYEAVHYPMPELTPNERLKLYMDERDLKQKDFLPIFGSSGITSEVVNGKRGISKAHAKKLAKFFDVSTELFI